MTPSSRRLLSATFWLFALCASTFSSSRTSALEQISEILGKISEEAADTWPLGSVLELTQHNFSEAVAKHDYLLVNFYAPLVRALPEIGYRGQSRNSQKLKIAFPFKLESK